MRKAAPVSTSWILTDSRCRSAQTNKAHRALFSREINREIARWTTPRLSRGDTGEQAFYKHYGLSPHQSLDTAYKFIQLFSAVISPDFCERWPSRLPMKAHSRSTPGSALPGVISLGGFRWPRHEVGSETPPTQLSRRIRI